ncbi:hypothetical protein BLS_001418 [Venturia inaequalis]|uniref:Brl1/Brr6 domain-containing protein n=1 Tax=Venturia inaequalis TaxID=5025 RepID=A0A8H3VHJ1_VENIN|nr:hypothetical protein BLS_001418 [Venturia inaequalis]KAE9987607.1 hypothetical protein EG328_002248 [Venturia inaequalis]KAE9993452.1 hypothetical protein EG327_004936 [Venturia inaequalis]RDI88926.1 hypothetical protein Vi05172_g1355 [Venturia inaequalis]
MSDRASYAQPMDFEFQNGTGQVSENSPWISSAAARAANKSSFRTNSNRGVSLAFSQQAEIDSIHATGKRPFSSFNSPAKPQLPQLREPHGERVLFSNLDLQDKSYNKPLPSTPTQFKSNLFSTPRTQLADSSGGETPDTVDNTADIEATPDTGMGFRTKMADFFGSSSKSPSKKTMVLSKGSPARGEVAKPYSNKIVKRRDKQTSRSSKRLRQQAEESDYEAPSPRKGLDSQKKEEVKEKRPHPVGAFFAWIEAHPTLPHTLSFYVQFFFDFLIAAGVLYVIYSMWSAVSGDVDKKAQEAVAEFRVEMAGCARQWQENQCDPAKFNVAPALINLCADWKKCFEKDPQSVGRAKVSAHTFAEILNSFVEPISFKAFVFSLVAVITLVALNHMAFGAFRNKAPPHHQQNQYMHPPPTPQRHPSGGWDYGYTPYGNHQSLPPPNWGQQGQQALEEAKNGGASPRKQLMNY